MLQAGVSHPLQHKLDAVVAGVAAYFLSTPKGSSPFQISISGVYNTVSAGETLVIGAAPTVTVAAGTLTPMQGLDATIGSPGSQQITAPADGDPKYLHIYAQYTINFTGGVGGRVANSVTGSAFVFEDSETNDFKEGGTFSPGGASYTHRTHIGSVVVVKRGSRRFARINQKRSGNIIGIQNFNSTSTGTSTDSSGTDVSAKTKSGIREVILCLNGEPYSTFILTGPLFEIT